MKRIGLLCLSCAILMGCATPQVSMPVGVASIMYANARADYAMARVYIGMACAAAKWDKEACEAARQIDIRAKVYRDAIEKALMNPEQPVDWVQVLKFSEEVTGLILKLGLMP